MSRFNFFKNIENRYKSKITLKKPLIIRFDGKGITKNPSINLNDETENSFSDALKRTAKYYSGKYRCIAYVSSDEINLVFEYPEILKRLYESVDIQKINSLLSQELFFIFNKTIDSQYPIYFDCRCFNIPEDKINSYLKYRINSCKNTSIHYFAKRANIDKDKRHGVSLDLVTSYLQMNSPEFNKRTIYQKQGLIYEKGSEIIPSNYFNESFD